MSFRKDFPALMLAALSLVVVVIMTSKTALKSDLNTIDLKNPPDFIMYYTGATMVKEGNIKNLYDVGVQKKTWDKALTPYETEGLLAFRAPAIVAYLLSPLALLSYTNAYLSLVSINFLLVAAVLPPQLSNIPMLTEQPVQERISTG